MQLEARKLIFDIQSAVDLLKEFTTNKTLDDYLADPMLRSAVERQFQIIGEAVNKLAKEDEELAANISEYKRLIGFRNVLIHGYGDVDDYLVWDLVETKLPVLINNLNSIDIE